MNTETTFDNWCIVELFGHSKISGKCTEQNIAGTNMLRVDVPETRNNPAFTKFFNAGAIYAINPVDESLAFLVANQLEIKPVNAWDLREFNDKQLKLKESAPQEEEEEEGLFF